MTLKNIHYIVTAFLCAFTFACKTQKLAAESKGITGTWRLTASLSDPGDGSGTWESIPKDTVRLITFNPDGTMTGNAIWGATNYQIKDSINIALTIQGSSNPIDYRYKVDQNTLLLNPPCREACGIRFIRTK